jgi:hypothetical protein
MRAEYESMEDGKQRDEKERNHLHLMLVFA